MRLIGITTLTPTIYSNNSFAVTSCTSPFPSCSVTSTQYLAIAIAPTANLTLGTKQLILDPNYNTTSTSVDCNPEVLSSYNRGIDTNTRYDGLYKSYTVDTSCDLVVALRSDNGALEAIVTLTETIGNYYTVTESVVDIFASGQITTTDARGSLGCISSFSTRLSLASSVNTGASSYENFKQCNTTYDVISPRTLTGADYLTLEPLTLPFTRDAPTSTRSPSSNPAPLQRPTQVSPAKTTNSRTVASPTTSDNIATDSQAMAPLVSTSRSPTTPHSIDIAPSSLPRTAQPVQTIPSDVGETSGRGSIQPIITSSTSNQPIASLLVPTILQGIQDAASNTFGRENPTRAASVSGTSIIFMTATTPAASQATFAISDQTYTAQAGHRLVIDGTTISSGGPPVTINGQAVSVGAFGVIVGSQVLPFSADGSMDASAPKVTFTFNGKTYAIQAGRPLVVDDATLYPGVPAVTIDGQPVSLGSVGVVVGSRTFSFSSDPRVNTGAISEATFTLDGQTYTAQAGRPLAIDGTTIYPEGPAKTIDGQYLSLGPDGIIAGTRTITFSAGMSADQSPFRDVGGVIASVIGMTTQLPQESESNDPGGVPSSGGTNRGSTIAVQTSYTAFSNTAASMNGLEWIPTFFSSVFSLVCALCQKIWKW